MLNRLLTLATAFSITSISLTGCHPGARHDGLMGAITPEGQIEEAFSIQGGLNDVNNHNRGKWMKNRWGKLVKELALTEEQKQSFQQMHREMQQRFLSNKGKRRDMFALLKGEFLKDSLNKETLKVKVEEFNLQLDAMLPQVAENIVKSYQVLTDEQRAKIEEKMVQRKLRRTQKITKMGKFHNKFRHKMFKRMTKGLDLTADQQTKIQAIFESSRPDKQVVMAQREAIHTAIKNELKSGADVTKITSILKQAKSKHEGNFDIILDKISQFHATLTPEQRQKLVAKVEKLPMFSGKHRKNHRFSHF